MDFEVITLTLISIVAPIGGFDVFYYHIYKLKLAQKPESWNETKTHIFRSFTLGIITLFLVFYKAQGAWFWFIGLLLAFDFLNNLVDAFLEYNSRRAQGGLPQFEYIVHVIGASSMGAVTLSFFVGAWELQFLDTQLVNDYSTLPSFLAINGIVIAIGSFLLALYESVVMFLSMKKHKRISQ